MSYRNAGEQPRAYIYVCKKRNLETMKSTKIYILTTTGIYIRPLCNIRGHQIKIGNILSGHQGKISKNSKYQFSSFATWKVQEMFILHRNNPFHVWAGLHFVEISHLKAIKTQKNFIRYNFLCCKEFSIAMIVFMQLFPHELLTRIDQTQF